MSQPEINSRAYWDDRFAGDWDAAQGPAQSRGFAELALARMPRWLLTAIAEEQLSVVDWGCAEGDGTAAWTPHVQPGQLTGVDFSTVAIERATARYPAIRFLAEDWLTTASEPGHDVVFSSNTLEHFVDPDRALTAIAGRARKALVLLLPYREAPRHPEHLADFVPERIPRAVARDFALCGAVAIECAALPDAVWRGEQVLLIYAEPRWIATLGLTLADLAIDKDDLAGQRDRLATAHAALEARVRPIEAELTALRARTDVAEAANRELIADGDRLRARITALEQRHAGRLSTRLYRLGRRLSGR